MAKISLCLLILVVNISLLAASDTLTGGNYVRYNGQYNSIQILMLESDTAGDSALFRITGSSLDGHDFIASRGVIARAGEPVHLEGIVDFTLLEVTRVYNYYWSDQIKISINETYEWQDDSSKCYITDEMAGTENGAVIRLHAIYDSSVGIGFGKNSKVFSLSDSTFVFDDGSELKLALNWKKSSLGFYVLNPADVSAYNHDYYIHTLTVPRNDDGTIACINVRSEQDGWSSWPQQLSYIIRIQSDNNSLWDTLSSGFICPFSGSSYYVSYCRDAPFEDSIRIQVKLDNTDLATEPDEENNIRDTIIYFKPNSIVSPALNHHTFLSGDKDCSGYTLNGKAVRMNSRESSVQGIFILNNKKTSQRKKVLELR